MRGGLRGRRARASPTQAHGAGHVRMELEVRDLDRQARGAVGRHRENGRHVLVVDEVLSAHVEAQDEPRQPPGARRPRRQNRRAERHGRTRPDRVGQPLTRAEHAALGMAPAQEGLGPVDSAAVEAHDRLVVQLELALGQPTIDRLAHPRLERTRHRVDRRDQHGLGVARRCLRQARCGHLNIDRVTAA